MTDLRHLNRTALTASAGLMLAALAAPALAAPVPSTEENRAAAAQRDDTPRADSQRRICVRAEFTGTRLSRRVCKTAAEWEAAGGLPTDAS